MSTGPRAGTAGPDGAARSRATPARLVLTAIALFTATGALAFDWNDTHVFNPEWPAHAKFHNGLGIILALLIGCLSLWYLWSGRGRDGQRLRFAVLLLVPFWIAFGAAVLVPGAGYTDPGEELPTSPANQTQIAVLVLLALALAYRSEMRRVPRRTESAEVR